MLKRIIFSVLVCLCAVPVMATSIDFTGTFVDDDRIFDAASQIERYGSLVKGAITRNDLVKPLGASPAVQRQVTYSVGTEGQTVNVYTRWESSVDNRYASSGYGDLIGAAYVKTGTRDETWNAFWPIAIINNDSAQDVILYSFDLAYKSSGSQNLTVGIYDSDIASYIWGPTIVSVSGDTHTHIDFGGTPVQGNYLWLAFDPPTGVDVNDFAYDNIVISQTQTPSSPWPTWGQFTPVAGYWSEVDDWWPGLPPVAGELVQIMSGGGTPCVLDITTPALTSGWMYDGSVLDIAEGGSLVMDDKMTIGYLPGDTAELIISGGNYYNSYGAPENMSPESTRLGYQAGSTGKLTITSGTFSTSTLTVGRIASSAGFVKVYGGLLELRSEADSNLQLNYYTPTGDRSTLDIVAPGRMTLGGDKRVWTINPFMDANDIFSSDPDTTIVVSYDGSKTILQGLTTNPATDFNRDNSVDLKDFAMFADVWQTIDATDVNEPNPNHLIFAPENTGITIDGSFGPSEWDNASDWAVFGKSFPDGEGLSSSTKARYAWDSTTDMLYIAIESTQADEYAQFQVGGLAYVNDTAGRTILPNQSWDATEIHFEYNGSSIVITNPYAEGGYTGRTDGIVAAHTYSGGVFRLEIKTPVYGKWRTNGGASEALSTGDDIYTYINILSDSSGTLRADSQCTRAGGQYDEDDDNIRFLYGGNVMSRGSAVRLLTSLPATCSDVPVIPDDEGNNPEPMKSSFDFTGDCSIGLDDLLIFLEDWIM